MAHPASRVPEDKAAANAVFPPRSRVPIFRISMANATVLSVAYLAMALVVDASRLWFPFYWTERASFTVEWIPSRTLDWLGLLEPMKKAVLDDQLTNFQARLILGLTSVAGIFAIALMVGTLMWLMRAVLTKAARGSPS
jgi:hypothetical protein